MFKKKRNIGKLLLGSFLIVAVLTACMEEKRDYFIRIYKLSYSVRSRSCKNLLAVLQIVSENIWQNRKKS